MAELGELESHLRDSPSQLGTSLSHATRFEFLSHANPFAEFKNSKSSPSWWRLRNLMCHAILLTGYYL